MGAVLLAEATPAWLNPPSARASAGHTPMVPSDAPALAHGEILTGTLRKAPFNPLDGMSAGGRQAYQFSHKGPDKRSSAAGDCLPGDLCLFGETDGPAGGQAETSIAVDVTGQHIVVGFNDTRGWSLNPYGLSGFMYSDDGGQTFTDGGQLTTTVPAGGSLANGSLADGTKLPQVFGDPEVKYVPGGAGCQFVYFSIGVIGYSGTAPNYTGVAQTLVFHRSIDCGHTWTGPYEVPPATNPHSRLWGSDAYDAADKEFADVDPDTGRMLLSWSNFTDSAYLAGGVEILTAYCDNIMAAGPSWAPAVQLNAGSTTFDTGSIPRFAGNGSSNAYVAYEQSSLTIWTANEALAVSANNGASWSAPQRLEASDFTYMDYVLGNDRVHQLPSVAVDTTTGVNTGNVYVVYANNNNNDGADIVFRRSTDGGGSFSPVMRMDSRPGSDRPQWFPWVTVDKTSGRVYVMYYDQGIASSGDMTEVTYQYSDDGGITWSKPAPLSERPFHAGYGNDTGQPNLGDYNQIVAQGDKLFAVWAQSPPLVLFTDGQPLIYFTVPDVVAKVVPADVRKAPLRLGPVSMRESGGNGYVDPGESVTLTVPLENYVNNPAIGNVTVTGIVATLTTAAPGVAVQNAVSTYADIATGATISPASSYILHFSPAFVPGARVELTLTLGTNQGSAVLPFTQRTGTPVPTVVYAENFSGVAPGSLPAGWTTIHGGGNNTVPWSTNASFCGASSNGLFHANANDGLSGDHTRFERVSTPNITIPVTAAYVTLDFDICYDLEDEPGLKYLAYDGSTLRITDLTAGNTARSVLPEAFAELITTGSILHYPKHTPRSSSTAYFQDMSVWAGDSGGWKHVSMILPGMAGTTVQLRPDYTQDSGATCANVRPGHPCGVAIDNIVLRAVTIAPVQPPSPSIVVNTTSDVQANDGLCSLREAILNANGDNQAGSIDCAAGSGADLITFSVTGPIVLGNALPLISTNVTVDGPGVTLSGNNANRIFIVGGVLTLRNLTITRGYDASNDGGAIYSTGTLNISNCRFLENHTGGGFSGGAIMSTGPLSITGSEFANNSAANGGAIYPRWAAATTTIANSSFHDNLAAAASPVGWGGAVLAWDGAQVTISSGSVFTGNQASYGGAVYVYANSALTVTDSKLNGNSAAPAGGAVYVMAGARSVMSNTELSANQITSVPGGSLLPNGGGAIHNQGSLSLDSVTLAGNAVPTWVPGGAIANFTGTVAIANSMLASNAGYDGGSIINATLGFMTISNTVLRGNNAGDLGGAVFNAGTLTLDRSSVSGNSAGGGGGVHNEGVFTVTASTFNGNTAAVSAGGVQNRGPASFTNSTISGNSAGWAAGGILNSLIGSLMLLNVTVAHNSSPSGGALLHSGSTGTNVTMKNTLIVAGASGANCVVLDVPGTIVSQGSNLSSDGSCSLFFTQVTDRNNTAANLGPLAPNGGPTLTHIPLPPSQAVDNASGCPATDQRGIVRAGKGLACDIGAVEYVPGERSPWLYLPLVVRLMP